MAGTSSGTSTFASGRAPANERAEDWLPATFAFDDEPTLIDPIPTMAELVERVERERR